MKFRYTLFFLLFSGGGVAVLGTDCCQSILVDLKLPAKLKTRGKPSRARWDQVDKVLTSLLEKLEGKGCEFTFDQAFKTTKLELYFPLTNGVLKTVPEGSLKGVPVFNDTGELLGQYENRFSYERTGGLYRKKAYRLYCFQFRDSQGRLQSSGNRLLLDSFLVKWEDIAKMVALSTQPG